MFNFAEIFPKQSKPNRQIKVINDIVIKLADGTTRHCSAGEIVEVTHRDSLGLDTNDFAFLDKETREPIHTVKAPERPSPAPLPDRWDTLPECFSKWHEINEKFATAAAHKRLITEARIRTFGTANSLGNPSGDVSTLIAVNVTFGKGKGINSNSRELRIDSPEVIAQEREFQRVENYAADHMQELVSTYAIAIQKLHLECGYARLNSCDQLTKITTEIRAAGLALFTHRIKALELHDSQVHRLYCGSALFQKYGTVNDPYVSGLSSAGYSSSGVIIQYVDDTVPAIAGGCLYDLQRIAELAPLLAEARKELAKAQKVAA